MATRHVLLLASSGLTAYRWQSGTVYSSESAFHHLADVANLQTFTVWLNQQRTSLFYLLADMADESFLIEDLPCVRGSDRAEMLKRKLAQHCRDTPLALIKSLGRVRTGRHDEKFLFADLPGHAQFAPYLQALLDTGTQLVGVYSVPFVLPVLAAQFIDKTQPVLLITITHAGLRQTFFDSGQMRFSRLTPMSTALIDNISAGCETEIGKIHQYLAGQRMITRDRPLTTLILAHPDHFAPLISRCQSTSERTIHMVDLLAESKRHGLKAPPDGSHADALLIHLLAKKPPPEQFAPSSACRQFHLRQARLAFNTAAAVMLAVCFFYSGIALLRYSELTDNNSLLQEKIALDEYRYAAMLNNLPPAPTSYTALRALTDRYVALTRHSPGLEPTLHAISRALDLSPTIDIDKIDWWIANTPDEVRGVPLNLDNAASVDSGAYIITLVSGQLPLTMTNDHQSQITAVNGFADRLGAADTKVQILALPFEMKSGKAIRSTDASDLHEPSGFTLKIVQKR
jgi:hypothetical protein